MIAPDSLRLHAALMSDDAATRRRAQRELAEREWVIVPGDAEEDDAADNDCCGCESEEEACTCPCECHMEDV